MMSYVGTSRVSLRFEIITELSDDDRRDILEKKLKYNSKIRKVEAHKH